jgi:hypothetical protein
MFLTIWGIKLPPKQNIFSLLQGCQQMLQGSGVKCFENKMFRWSDDISKI